MKAEQRKCHPVTTRSLVKALNYLLCWERTNSEVRRLYYIKEMTYVSRHRQWLRGFLIRNHKQIAIRKLDNLVQPRREQTETTIRQWFSNAKQIIEKDDLETVMLDPKRYIFLPWYFSYLASKPCDYLYKTFHKMM